MQLAPDDTRPSAPEAASRKSPLEALSEREREVFRYMGEGRGTKAIAGLLSVSPKTVQTYHARMKKKLRVVSFIELLCEAARWRAATLDEAP